MPYEGITDVKMAFPVIGKLHKGSPKPNPKQPGRNLHYFRFESDFMPGIVEDFYSTLGKEPASIKIYLPYADIWSNWDVWGYVYGASRLAHKCTGKWVVYEYDKQREIGLRYDVGTKECAHPDCKPVGSLVMVIPALLKAGYVGTVMLTTTSERDMRNISATLQYYHSLAGGDLRGIEFDLFRYQFNAPTKGGPRRKQWFVGLRASPQFVATQLTAGTVQAVEVKELPAQAEGIDPETIDHETGEIFDDEALEGVIVDDETPETKPDNRAEQAPTAQAERAGDGGPFADEPRNQKDEPSPGADPNVDETLTAMQRTRSLTGLSKTAAARYDVKQSEIVPVLVETFGGSDFWPYTVDHTTEYITALEATFAKEVKRA